MTKFNLDSNKEKANLINFIFSCLVVVNVILFLFVVPGLIYLLRTHHFENKKFYTYFFMPFILIFITFFSYKSFYEGINLPDMEGRPTRYGPMSGGDKELFSLFSKPIAFMMQFFSIFMQFLLLIAIYK